MTQVQYSQINNTLVMSQEYLFLLKKYPNYTFKVRYLELSRTALVFIFLNEIIQGCRSYFKLPNSHPAECPVSRRSPQLVQSHPPRRDFIC